MSTGTGTGVVTGTGTGTGTAGTGTGTGTGTAGTGTGTGAGTCGPGPAGGAACDPGIVECSGVACAVPANECCFGSGSGAPDTCIAKGAACASGQEEPCDEATDCGSGGNCCLAVNIAAETFVITCKTGACPTGLGKTQVCKTNAECPGGSCSLYSCEGNSVESCGPPVAGICTKM